MATETRPLTVEIPPLDTDNHGRCNIECRLNNIDGCGLYEDAPLKEVKKNIVYLFPSPDCPWWEGE